MPTTIRVTKAVEESTFVITAALTDEDGTAVVPNALTWTLSRSDGTVINAREDVTIAPASTVSIVLSGDDLQVFPNDDLERVLTLQGSYDSTLGSGLPVNDELYFSLVNLINVP